MIPTLS